VATIYEGTCIGAHIGAVPVRAHRQQQQSRDQHTTGTNPKTPQAPLLQHVMRWERLTPYEVGR